MTYTNTGKKDKMAQVYKNNRRKTIMEKSNEKTNLVPMLIYNMLSAVMVVVSLFVFNRLVLILDICVFVASLALILLFKINFISTPYGALNFLHILIPCVLFYRSDVINLID